MTGGVKGEGPTLAITQIYAADDLHVYGQDQGPSWQRVQELLESMYLGDMTITSIARTDGGVDYRAKDGVYAVGTKSGRRFLVEVRR